MSGVFLLRNFIFRTYNINCRYADGTHALRNFSFSLMSDEKLALVGANGSGKSTLLLHLMGCMEPVSGRIEYKGEAMGKEMYPKLRRETGMLFQNPEDQLIMTRVWDDVAFGPRNMGLTEDEVRTRVTESLERTGISHLAAREPWKLSGGEKSLVALAGILAMNPSAILLDEPTSGLDPCSRRKLIGIIRELDCSVLIATHDLDMVVDVCNRVLVLDRGTAAAESPVPGVLYDRDIMMSHSLELPLGYHGLPNENSAF